MNSFTPEEIRKGTTPYKGALGISVGRSHLCVITADQQVECLGDGSKGQLGAVDSQTLKFAVVQNDKKLPLKDIWQIRSKEDFTCGLKQESGSIWCWGEWKGDRSLSAHQLLEGGRPSSDFIQITLNHEQICGVHGIDRVVYCTTPGEKTVDKLNLAPVTDNEGHPLKKIMAIAGGKQHICATDEEGKLFCWGSNEVGQLGVPGVKESTKPMKVVFKNPHLLKVIRLTTGDRHTCVANGEDPALFCFGENFFGGTNSPEALEYPL